MKIVVSHPTRQHSDKLAFALNANNMLSQYFTLLPDRRALRHIPAWFDKYLPRTIFRNSLEPIPVERIKVLLGPLLIQRITHNNPKLSIKNWGEYISWVVFDKWVASKIEALVPDVVVGYEMCCLETFKEAKRLGIPRVLDAAACHYRYVDRVMPEKLLGHQNYAGQSLRNRKDEEIALASQILCVSEFAAKSYTDHGVPKNKVILNPLGCDLSLFNRASLVKTSTDVNLLFIGQQSYHKGFDILIKVFESLLQTCPQANLTVIGPGGDWAKKDRPKNIRCRGMLTHSEIVAELERADCLILPSRCESFGLVVLEALASGTPVIVSKRAGSSMAVKEGHNGWLFDPNIWTELHELVLKFSKNIIDNRTKGTVCRESVRTWHWDSYKERAVVILKDLIK